MCFHVWEQSCQSLSAVINTQSLKYRNILLQPRELWNMSNVLRFANLLLYAKHIKWRNTMFMNVTFPWWKSPGQRDSYELQVFLGTEKNNFRGNFMTHTRFSSTVSLSFYFNGLHAPAPEMNFLWTCLQGQQRWAGWGFILLYETLGGEEKNKNKTKMLRLELKIGSLVLADPRVLKIAGSCWKWLETSRPT